jgi:S1-C subfamily serine protease
MSEHKEHIATMVEAATVRLVDVGGQGVLVPGGFILTAAHCVDWDGHGGMALGDHMLESVETKDGKRFRLSVAAVEPCADIAVLECADNQMFYDDADAFESWVEQVAPVPVRDSLLAPDEPILIHVLTHDRGWVGGRATKHGLRQVGRVAIETIDPIEGGTSGGPVVDADGALVGVVSWTAEGSGAEGGAIPLACHALPAWVLAAIREATP